jgi:hypothetical protein
MSNYQIVARHPALGEIHFTVTAAADSKAAFAKWKNIVFSPRQWSIVSNEPLDGGVAEPPPVQVSTGPHESDCSCDTCFEL